MGPFHSSCLVFQFDGEFVANSSHKQIKVYTRTIHCDLLFKKDLRRWIGELQFPGECVLEISLRVKDRTALGELRKHSWNLVL